MGTLDYKVIDKFLDEEVFKNLQKLIMSQDFPWFFQNHQVTDDDPYFSHLVFKENKYFINNTCFFKYFT